MKHDQADKLDCLMHVMFEYITNICIENGKYAFEHIAFFFFYSETVNYEQSKSLFRDLLNIFNKILLPTHDSSHVQFLLFYICSFHTVNSENLFQHDQRLDFVCFQDFSDEFMNNSWKTFVSPSVSMTFRQAAISYLCSLIARAKYIATR